MKSLKALFAGKEVIITVEPVEEKKMNLYSANQDSLLKMIAENREKAPLVKSDIDIRQIIDDSQHPGL